MPRCRTEEVLGAPKRPRVFPFPPAEPRASGSEIIFYLFYFFKFLHSHHSCSKNNTSQSISKSLTILPFRHFINGYGRVELMWNWTWWPLIFTILGCFLLNILIDKQHKLTTSLIHLQEALSHVHYEQAKVRANHTHQTPQ